MVPVRSSRLLRFHRDGIGCLVVLACLALAGPSPAQGDLRTELEDAEDYYIVGEYERSLDVLDRILIAQDLNRQIHLDAGILKARCLVRVGQSDAARNAFLEALALDESWRPDPNLMPADEIHLFQSALDEYRESRRFFTEDVCPSKRTPWIGTGAAAAATFFALAAKGSADDRWADYESDPAHPVALYDKYEDSTKTRNVAVGVAVSAGIVAGYYWWRYARQKRSCSEAASLPGALEVAVSPPGLAVVWRF